MFKNLLILPRKGEIDNSGNLWVNKSMSKSEERLIVRRLRLNGESVRKITKIVGVSKSSVSRWCRDIDLTDEQIEKLTQKAEKNRIKARWKIVRSKRLERLNNFMSVGRKRVDILSEREIFLVGVALYWAEGGKKHRRVVLTNSDPNMIRLWIFWLQKCMGVNKDRLTCCVGINQIHEYRIEKVQDYWLKVVGVPINQFLKPSFKKVQNKKIYKNHDRHYGTLTLRVRRSTNMNYEILGQIDQLKKQLGSEMVK